MSRLELWNMESKLAKGVRKFQSESEFKMEKSYSIIPEFPEGMVPNIRKNQGRPWQPRNSGEKRPLGPDLKNKTKKNRSA